MGKVLRQIQSGNKIYLECTDLFADIDGYIEKIKYHGIPEENITITIENDSSVKSAARPVLSLSLDEVRKTRNALKVLTSHVKEEDTEEEKFAKIVTAMTKNIKYAYLKTGNRNVGKNKNFVDGLLKGKCVCYGMAQILKEALNMHGIESEFAFTDFAKKSGHVWNTVKLGGKWYNWDQTNILSEVWSLDNIGKLLKTDAQIADKKLYKNKDSKITCDTVPPRELVSTINSYAKENKNKAPKLPRNTFLSRSINKIKGIDNNALLLPEAITQKNDISANQEEMQIVDDSIIGIVEDMFILKMQVWDRSSINNKIRASYLGIPDSESMASIMGINQEGFWKAYRDLVSGVLTDNSYIGNVYVIENEDLSKELLIKNISSQECKKMSEEVKYFIEKDQVATKNRFNIQQEPKEKELYKEKD